MVHLYDADHAFDYTGAKRDKSYCFDNVFEETASNQGIYDSTIQPLVKCILDGFNVTCFAYGMTGSGKTHTMLGTSSSDQNYQEIGMCQLAIQGLFLGMMERQLDCEYDLRISYLEIYNEQVRDLLAEKSGNLMIVEDPARGIIVPDLQEFRVNCIEELESLIMVGNQRRIMAPTGANQFSSRSHAILIFSIECKNKNRNIKEQVFYSKLQMIDLAGSERAAASDNRGQRMVEGANINKSLLALGNCINILSDKAKTGSFVPYRDSKLTRLLKDSLGGNTKTIMLACVSQSFQAYEETVNTLKYASRARNIKRITTRNVKEVEMHVSKYKDIIENLRGEIEFLREQLQTQQNQSMNVSPFKSPISQQPASHLTSQRDKRLPISRPMSTRQGTQKASPIRPNTKQQSAKKETNNSQQKLDMSDSLSFINNVENNQIVEIEEEIFKTQTQKRQLEQELMLSGKKSQENEQQDIEEQLYIEKLSQNLLANFEEHWELKQSISELEELQQKNQEQLVQLKKDIIELDKQLELKQGNQILGQQISKVLQFKQNELKIIEKNFQSNIQILNDMKKAIEINIEQKTKLQGMLLKMHSTKKSSLIETQIEMRKLRLEKTNLHLQNLEMKKITQQQILEKDQNEMKIAEMQKQLELMHRQLQEKDMIIVESQKQLQKKDIELKYVTKSSHLKHLSFGGSQTMKFEPNTLIQEPRRETIQGAANSARAQWNVQPTKQNEMSKKLVLSGFFEDDFQGDVLQEGKQKETAPSTLNIVSTVLQQKRQSQDNQAINKKKKGCTPNNRYKQGERSSSEKQKNKDLSISNIAITNVDINQSDVMQFDEIFNDKQQTMNLRKTQESNPNEIVIAQINLYQDEKEGIQLHQPVLQSSNKRYEEHAKKSNNYESRRESQSSKQKRSSKLNRYLSFQRKTEEDDDKTQKNDESEKENFSRNPQKIKYLNLQNDEQTLNNEMFKTFSQIDSKQQQVFSPASKYSQQNDLKTEIVNKFEQRKYSQPTIHKQDNKSQQKVQRKPSPSRQSQESSLTSTSSVFQSYAQIRKASKERQQQQSQTKPKQTPSQIKDSQGQQYKASQNTYQSKASAAATISKYVPIKPTHSSNASQSNGIENIPGQYSLQAQSSSSNTYFENFIKKKKTFANFNSQPMSLATSQRTGAVKALNHCSPLIQSQNVQSVQFSGEACQSQELIVTQINRIAVPPTAMSSQSIEEIINSQTYQSIQTRSQKLNKNVDDLLNKQKTQLNREKEKLQKNQYQFTNSFGSTLASLQQKQGPQTERHLKPKEDQICERQNSERQSRYNNDEDADDKLLDESPSGSSIIEVPTTSQMGAMRTLK